MIQHNTSGLWRCKKKHSCMWLRKLFHLRLYYSFQSNSKSCFMNLISNKIVEICQQCPVEVFYAWWLGEWELGLNSIQRVDLRESTVQFKRYSRKRLVIVWSALTYDCSRRNCIIEIWSRIKKDIDPRWRNREFDAVLSSWTNVPVVSKIIVTSCI